MARGIGSIKVELLNKSREAALSAISIFNNPQTVFKSESYIVLMIIAWTYLLHAYYRSRGIEYRHYHQGPKRKIFHRTARGSYKYWELERCINETHCPLDRATKMNLLFLINLRHEIEHQMTMHLDAYLGGRYQACALNYNRTIKHLFGAQWALDDRLSFSIQFMELSEEQILGQRPEAKIPENLRAYIVEFDNILSEEDINSDRFSYRMLFTRKLVNHSGQADKVLEFVPPNSELGQAMSKQVVVKKEVERPKYLPGDIVKRIREIGFSEFSMHHHTEFWKAEKARDESTGFGTFISGQWYWYQKWLDRVVGMCEAAGEKYR